MLISASDRENDRQLAAVRRWCNVNCLKRARVIYDFLLLRFSIEKRNGSPSANEKHVFSLFQLFDLILAESATDCARNIKRRYFSTSFLHLSGPITNFSALEFETITVYFIWRYMYVHRITRAIRDGIAIESEVAVSTLGKRNIASALLFELFL